MKKNLGVFYYEKVVECNVDCICNYFCRRQNNFAEARDPSWQVVGIRTYLSIREYPTVNSRELARVPNGTYLSWGGAADSNGFVSVYYNGIYGWASRTYLR